MLVIQSGDVTSYRERYLELLSKNAHEHQSCINALRIPRPAPVSELDDSRLLTSQQQLQFHSFPHSGWPVRDSGSKAKRTTVDDTLLGGVLSKENIKLKTEPQLENCGYQTMARELEFSILEEMPLPIDVQQRHPSNTALAIFLDFQILSSIFRVPDAYFPPEVPFCDTSSFVLHVSQRCDAPLRQILQSPLDNGDSGYSMGKWPTDHCRLEAAQPKCLEPLRYFGPSALEPQTLFPGQQTLQLSTGSISFPFRGKIGANSTESSALAILGEDDICVMSFSSFVEYLSRSCTIKLSSWFEFGHDEPSIVDSLQLEGAALIGSSNEATEVGEHQLLSTALINELESHESADRSPFDLLSHFQVTINSISGRAESGTMAPIDWHVTQVLDNESLSLLSLVQHCRHIEAVQRVIQVLPIQQVEERDLESYCHRNFLQGHLLMEYLLDPEVPHMFIPIFPNPQTVVGGKAHIATLRTSLVRETYQKLLGKDDLLLHSPALSEKMSFLPPAELGVVMDLNVEMDAITGKLGSRSTSTGQKRSEWCTTTICLADLLAVCCKNKEPIVNHLKEPHIETPSRLSVPRVSPDEQVNSAHAKLQSSAAIPTAIASILNHQIPLSNLPVPQLPLPPQQLPLSTATAGYKRGIEESPPICQYATGLGISERTNEVEQPRKASRNDFKSTPTYSSVKPASQEYSSTVGHGQSIISAARLGPDTSEWTLQPHAHPRPQQGVLECVPIMAPIITTSAAATLPATNLPTRRETAFASSINREPTDLTGYYNRIKRRSVESMVDSYFDGEQPQLHQVDGPPSSEIFDSGIQPQWPAAASTMPISPVIREQSKAPISPPDTQNISLLTGLRILVSEGFMEDYNGVLCGLTRRYGIESVDVPLAAEKAISIVVDLSTSIAVIEIDSNVNLPETLLRLKAFVKQLTSECMRYDTIYILLVLSGHTSIGVMLAMLYQSLSRFPCQVLVREVWIRRGLGAGPATVHTHSLSTHREGTSTNAHAHSHDIISRTIFEICLASAKSYCRAKGESVGVIAYLDRPYLVINLRPSQRIHGEFLQFFPTINIMLALVILHKYHLKEVPQQLRSKEAIERLLHPHLSFQHAQRIEKMVALMHEHFGIEAYL